MLIKTKDIDSGIMNDSSTYLYINTDFVKIWEVNEDKVVVVHFIDGHSIETALHPRTVQELMEKRNEVS